MKIIVQFFSNAFKFIIIIFLLVGLKSIGQCIEGLTGALDDFDCDGVANRFDTDSDNDGITDEDEGCERSPTFPGGFVSMFHTNIVNVGNGRIFITGEEANPGVPGDPAPGTDIKGNADSWTEILPGGAIKGSVNLVSNPLLATNWPNYSGENVKATGAFYRRKPQLFLLTTTNLYVWGAKDFVITQGVTNESWTNVPFPLGTNASEFKDIVCGTGILALVTNDGRVYTRGSLFARERPDGVNWEEKPFVNSPSLYGSNTMIPNDSWRLVRTSASGNPPLTDVDKIEITHNGAFAVTTSNVWYTWGPSVFLGGGEDAQELFVATPMEKPKSGFKLKELDVCSVAFWTEVRDSGGVNVDEQYTSYYALDEEEGTIYVLGGNHQGQLGLGTQTRRTNWVRVRKEDNSVLRNVIHISASSQGNGFANAGAIVAENKGTLNETREIYLWGANDSNATPPQEQHYSLSEALDLPQLLAGKPSYFGDNPSDVGKPGAFKNVLGSSTVGPEDRFPVALGVGGHLTVYLDYYQDNFAFVGHNANGCFGVDSDDVSNVEEKFVLIPLKPDFVFFGPDIDNDKFYNCFDRDSDNDGCNDVIELGAEGDGNGRIVGNGNVDTTENSPTWGQVQGTSGGYIPVNHNTHPAYLALVLDVGTPTSLGIKEGIVDGSLTITPTNPIEAFTTKDYSGTTPVKGSSPIDVSSSLNFEWFLGEPPSGISLLGNTDYTGADTKELTIKKLEPGQDGSNYYLVVTHPDSCLEERLTTSLSVLAPILETTMAVTQTTGTINSPAVGDEITFTVTLTNTGTADLTNLEMQTPPVFTYLIGSPNNIPLVQLFGPNLTTSGSGTTALLEPGETLVYTYTHNLTQEDFDGAGVNLEVVGQGQTTGGSPTTISDGSNIDFPLTSNAEIRAIKTAGGFTPPAGLGDTVIFTIEIINTGNVTLTGITFVDDFRNGDGTISFGGTSPVLATSGTTLAPGENTIMTATHTITPADVSSGVLRNIVNVEGFDPEGGPVTDTSGPDINTNTDTVVPINELPSLTVVMTASPSPAAFGDEVIFTITVTNTGDVPLNNLDFTTVDFQDFLAAPLGVTASDIIFDSASLGSLEGNLAVSEIATYTFTYSGITLSDVNAGGIQGTVRVEGDSPGTTGIGDTSDDPSVLGNDDPTRVPILQAPAIAAVKTSTVSDDALPTGNSAGDLITYTIEFHNTGNATLTSINFIDTFENDAKDVLTFTIPPTFVSNSETSLEKTLLPGEIATYTATYIIQQADVDSGKIINSLLVSGTAPDGSIKEDLSGSDITNDSADEVLFSQTSGLTTVMTANPSTAELGDVIVFTIVVTNTGTVTLTGLSITDIEFTDFNDVDLPPSGLTAVTLVTGPDIGGELAPGESSTFTITYDNISLSDFNSGGIRGSVTGNGVNPSANTISDISGTDATNDDTTDVPVVTQSGGLEIVKTAEIFDTSGAVTLNAVVGNTVTYTITVENIGNVTIDDISLVDNFTDFSDIGFTNNDNSPLVLIPVFNGPTASDGSPEGTLIPGETATYTVDYVITADAIVRGGIRNQVIGTGSTPLDEPVTDESDDGDDTDGNTENDPTDIETISDPSISVIKESDLIPGSDAEFDDGPIVINYTIRVTNTGLSDIETFSFTDTMTDCFGNANEQLEMTMTTDPGGVTTSINNTSGSIITQNLVAGDALIFTYSHTITQEEYNSGCMQNAVEFTAITADGNSAEGNAFVEDRFGCLEIFNQFSPDDDGFNDYFVINCIENYPNNKLEVYNRWGNLVYEKQGYNNDWDGTSMGRATINADAKLPEGTYFYVFDYGDGVERDPSSGWLYINR